MNTNANVVKGSIGTQVMAVDGTVQYGHNGLSYEQAKKFLKDAINAATLLPHIRHEMRSARSGEINKIGIEGRIMQAKVEGQAGTEKSVVHSLVPYNCKGQTVPWSINEEVFQDNIEREGYEDEVFGLMSEQYGTDQEDLGLNGDESSSDVFEKQNDGWIKQIKAGGHVVVSPVLDNDMWHKIKQSIPSKYQTGKLRWIVSPKTRDDWQAFCESKALAGGNTNLLSINAPCGYEFIVSPKMPDGTVILTAPKNLILVSHTGVRVRKSTEGKDAVQADVRYYAIHNAADYIIEEVKATAIATGITIKAAPTEPDADESHAA